LAEGPPVDAVRWLDAFRQLVTTLQVSSSACLAALVVKGSLAAAKLSAIVSLVTATLGVCAALLLHGPPTDSLCAEEQHAMPERLVRPLLGYVKAVLFSTRSSVGYARQLGQDNLQELLMAGPASSAGFLCYAGAFFRHALTVDGRLHPSNSETMQGRRPHCT
jgi:hypothetical protein